MIAVSTLCSQSWADSVGSSNTRLIVSGLASNDVGEQRHVQDVCQQGQGGAFPPGERRGFGVCPIKRVAFLTGVRQPEVPLDWTPRLRQQLSDISPFAAEALSGEVDSWQYSSGW